LESFLSAGNKNKKILKVVLLLTSAYFVIQILVGFKIGSLALISDAGHMLIDVAGIVMGLVAISFTQKPASPTRTYGFYRAEILASFLNSLFLILLSLFILFEAYQRIIHPVQVSGLPIIIIASIGLVINLAVIRLLPKTLMKGESLQDRHYSGKSNVKEEENMNIHGVYLEVFADAIGSAGVIVAGIIIQITGFYLADALISIGIAAFILPRTWLLLKRAIHILIEGAPSHLCHEEIKNAILGLKAVTGVFDLHIWTITSGIHALSAHVVIMDKNRSQQILQEINSMLEKKFNITHATVQIESYHESNRI
jgi:cobalt-zinc-cadmium efflux system protein